MSDLSSMTFQTSKHAGFTPRQRSGERSPEQIEAARERYMRSPHFQARVQLQKERILEKEQSQARNRAAFEGQRAERAALRAKDNLGLEDQAFAKRTFDNLGAAQPEITKNALSFAKSLSEAGPHLWTNSEPAKMAAIAFRTTQEYVKGAATNEALHNAIKDMQYANGPTTASARTGDIKPEREAAAKAWGSAIEAGNKLLSSVRTADRAIEKTNTKGGPDKGPAR